MKVKVRVIKIFIDKHTKKLMEVSDGISYDEAPEYEEERAQELVEKGFVEIWHKEEPKEIEEEPKKEEKPKAKKKK